MDLAPAIARTRARLAAGVSFGAVVAALYDEDRLGHIPTLRVLMESAGLGLVQARELTENAAGGRDRTWLYLAELQLLAGTARLPAAGWLRAYRESAIIDRRPWLRFERAGEGGRLYCAASADPQRWAYSSGLESGIAAFAEAARRAVADPAWQPHLSIVQDDPDCLLLRFIDVPDC